MPSVIFQDLSVAEILARDLRGEDSGLGKVKFEDEAAGEFFACLGDERADKGEAIRAAVEGRAWLAEDFALEGWDLRARDVWEICDDEVDGGGYFREKVAFHEGDAPGQAEPRGVFAGDGEGGVGNIERGETGLRKCGGERERDAAAAGADIHDVAALPRAGVAFSPRDEQLAKLFGLGPRDEGAVVAEECVAEEFRGAEDVLERFAGGAAFDEFAEGREFRLAKGAIEFEVELHALFPKHMRKEMLDVQARAFDVIPGEVISGRGDHFEDGLHVSIAARD